MDSILTQAAWNLLEYRNHQEDPSVVRLTVHLPGKIPVYFTEDAQRNPEQLQMALDHADSTLTIFLKYNQEHTDGRHLLYQDFPKHFRY